MFKRLLSLGGAALAAVTAACEDGPATVAGTWRSPATWSTMVWASAEGPMLVEVHGRPFANLAAAELDPQVAAALSNQVIGRVVTFTHRRDDAPRPEYRVVLAFNAPDKTDASELCAGPVATAAAPRDRITVIAAFCDGGRALSSVRGWVAKVDGPADQRFRQLLGQVARDLFGNPE
ncbi:MAG: hypothetical protein ACM33T_15695 [Solirubrobacterales bacterium]